MLIKKKIAREEYIKDRDKRPPRTTVVSADLMKVALLPHMARFKDAAFTPRLVCFNETFAYVGKCPEGRKSNLALWHEATAGRKWEQIASTYYSFLKDFDQYKDEKIVIWADNCVAQNKAWGLYSNLIDWVNNHLTADIIEIKYFAKGHSYMSADNVHALCEQAMDKAELVYDFAHFVEMCNSSSKTHNSVPLGYCDFYAFKDLTGQPKARTSPKSMKSKK